MIAAGAADLRQRRSRRRVMPLEREILALNAFDRSCLSATDAALREAVQRRLRSLGSVSVLFY